MKIHEIMNPNVLSCRPETDLAAAAMMMWDGDCGVLPIVGSDQKLKGVITDRDICIALGSRHRRAEEVTVQEVRPGKVFACGPEDDIHMALEVMADHQVRRLPVVDAKQRLVGMLSIKDLILAAKAGRGRKAEALKCEEVLGALQAICRDRRSPKQKRKAVAA